LPLSFENSLQWGAFANAEKTQHTNQGGDVVPDEEISTHEAPSEDSASIETAEPEKLEPEEQETSQEAEPSPDTEGSSDDAAPDEGKPQEKKPRRELDTGVVISMTSGLLKDMVQSGSDFRTLSASSVSDEEFEEMCERAQEREEKNDRVFSGEKDALVTLRGIEDDELNVQIHKKARDYARRASTSNKVALALGDSYDNSLEPGADPEILNPERLRRQLKELLSVVVSLSEQRAGLVDYITSSKAHFEELIEKRYHDRTETLLAEFDVLGMEFSGLSKMHFKRRSALREEMKEKLEELDKINAEYTDYAFIEVQTRELPTA
jgi:hypothetical protein